MPQISAGPAEVDIGSKRNFDSYVWFGYMYALSCYYLSFMLLNTIRYVKG